MERRRSLRPYGVKLWKRFHLRWSEQNKSLLHDCRWIRYVVRRKSTSLSRCNAGWRSFLRLGLVALVTKPLHRGSQGSLRPLGPFLQPRRQGQYLAVSLYPDTLGAPSTSVKVQMFYHLRTMGPPLTVKGLRAFKARPYCSCHRVQASRLASPLGPLVFLPHLPGDRAEP